jgi:DNA-directed RNA polymerase specialized sigma24 family protein
LKHLGLIVHGLAVDEYRFRGRFIPAGLAEDLAEDLEEALEADQLPHVQLLTHEADTFRRRFDSGVRALPSAERDAYILTDLRGLTEREACLVLGVSQMTVNRRAENARHFLRLEIA